MGVLFNPHFLPPGWEPLTEQRSYLRTLGTVKELLQGGAMPMEVLKKRLGPAGAWGDGLKPKEMG